jgi:peptidase E
MNPTRLLALGGGGFTDAAARPLDDFALGLTGRDRPRVCLLATASGDASAYVAAFYRTFADRAECAHVSLFQRDGGDMRSLVLGQDLLYVGGGNTANLLALWRLHGLDAIVRDAYQAGVVIAGVSAGACALFEAGVSASFGAIAPLNDGLGLVPGGFCPHWHERRGVLLEMVSGGLSGGWGAGDDAALFFVDGGLREAVGLRSGADAFRVEPGPVEVRVPVRRLAPSAS